jgi:hypothetical protein
MQSAAFPAAIHEAVFDDRAVDSAAAKACLSVHRLLIDQFVRLLDRLPERGPMLSRLRL